MSRDPYTPEIAAEILERIARGESVRSIAKDPLMPSEPTIRMWVVNDRDGFASHYARAKEAGIEALVEEIMEISDDATNDWMASNNPDDPGYKLNAEHVQRSKLRVDSRKWYASKIVPKKYGESQRIEHSGSVDIATRIQESRKRSGGS